MKLYELSEQYRKFHDMVEDALSNPDLDLSEDDLQLFIDTLDGLKDGVEVKVENIIKFIKTLQGYYDAYKKEEERLYKSKKYVENKINGLKKYTQDMLENAGIEKLQAGLFNVRLQKNPPSVEVVDINKLQSKYLIPQDPKIATKDILNDLKNGVNVDGAKLVDDKKHLRF